MILGCLKKMEIENQPSGNPSKLGSVVGHWIKTAVYWESK